MQRHRLLNLEAVRFRILLMGIDFAAKSRQHVLGVNLAQTVAQRYLERRGFSDLGLGFVWQIDAHVRELNTQFCS